MKQLAICLLFICILVTQSEASPPLHWTVLDIPVLIEQNVNNHIYHGTGVILDMYDGVYLATAKHVFYNMSSSKLISNKAKVLAYQGIDRQREPSVLELKLCELEQKKLLKGHATHDVAIVQLANKKTIDGKETSYFEDNVSVVLGLGKARMVAGKSLKNMGEVPVSQDIFVFGYPTSLGLADYAQFESYVPLIRKCVVSGKNNTRKTIIIDCPVYHGNSGGPVMATFEDGNGVTNYNLIGLVTEYIPFKMDKFRSPGNEGVDNSVELYSNSGYSVVEPIDVVLELLRK